jgi:hypothetical protein
MKFEHFLNLGSGHEATHSERRVAVLSFRAYAPGLAGRRAVMQTPASRTRLAGRFKISRDVQCRSVASAAMGLDHDLHVLVERH